MDIEYIKRLTEDPELSPSLYESAYYGNPNGILAIDLEILLAIKAESKGLDWLDYRMNLNL